MKQYKPRKKIGIGFEGEIHKQFGALMRKYEALNRLDCVFWSYSGSGERRTLSTGSLLKAKGLKPGQPDYHFIKRKAMPGVTINGKILYMPNGNEPNIDIDYYIYLEFKKPKTSTAKGCQSESQRDFEARFRNSINSCYYVVYSIDQALKVLEKEEILLT